MRVLVLNCGSSSLKFKLYSMENEIELVHGALAVGDQDAADPTRARDHSEALERSFATIATAASKQIDVIGHRVVHGGPKYEAPALITDDVTNEIARYAALAPLHNRAALKGIETASRTYPAVPQVAVFDTAFHRTIPDTAATYPLPKEWLQRYGIRRYGFHGISCSWALAKTAEFLGRTRTDLNIIVLHLGAGASVTAIRGGRSVDTSMGLSPLEGIMMQTRAGDLDPGAMLSLLRAGVPIEELDRVLNHDCGVKGVAGDADMLTVERRASSGDVDAAFAREMYAYRAAKYVGAYAGLVWPLDALVFTGGIGEHDSSLRAAICAAVPQLGLFVDPLLNAVASSDSRRSIRPLDGPVRPEILVVRADEELEIARETAAMMNGPRTTS